MVVTSGTVLNGFNATLVSITNAEERQRFLQAGDFIRSLTGDFNRDPDQFTLLGKTDAGVWDIPEVLTGLPSGFWSRPRPGRNCLQRVNTTRIGSESIRD
jgi:hypothetical protein